LIVLDTNVLVYTVGRDHVLREPCQRVVRAIADGDLAATTTIGVLEEFLHLRAKRSDRSEAVRLTERYVCCFRRCCSPSPATPSRRYGSSRGTSD
jgi:hypothetical protein